MLLAERLPRLPAVEVCAFPNALQGLADDPLLALVVQAGEFGLGSSTASRRRKRPIA
jgi:hypothetical protein